MSDLNQKCIESWQRVLPGYQIKRWDESNVSLDDAYSRAAFAAGAWSRLTNVVRMRVLHDEGGIYLDTDVEVLKPFDPLLEHECFLGFQQEEERNGWVNGAVVGARAGHPFLRQCVEATQESFAATGEFPLNPVVMTRLLKNMGLKTFGLQDVGGVTVYPPRFFYPYPWYGSYSPGSVTEETYCIHHWEGSWRKREEGPIRRFMRRLIPRARHRDTGRL